jgi:lipopolysaccharide transport system permease protein
MVARKLTANLHLAQLIWFRAICELKAKSARDHLNILWWFLEPILYMSVFYVVFGVLMPQGHTENFPAFLLIGIVVWRWFAGAIQQSVPCIPHNAHLINLIYIPKYAFPLMAVVQHTIKFFIVLGMLAVFLWYSGARPGSAVLWLPVVLIVQFAFIVACALFIASIHPFVPDIRGLVDSGLLMLFFLSGIFFKIHVNPNDWSRLYDYNPMAVLVTAFRDTMLNGSVPDLRLLLAVFLFSCAVGGLGYAILRRYDRLYVKLSVS